MTRTDPIEALLSELIAEVRAVRMAIEGQRRPSALSKADRVTLERLLQALAIVFPGGELFTSRDVVAHSAPGLRVFRRGLSTKSLGRLFTRAAGTPIGGYRIDRVGTELRVCLWRVVAA